MGFYSPSLLIQDARRHGVDVQPVDLTSSDWESRVEKDGSVRLGLREIKGFSKKVAERISACRAERPFADIADLASRALLQQGDLNLLSAADALKILVSAQ